MCGICGIAGKREETQIRRMTGIMEHRGPDDEGFYIDDDISLGVKRLAIIDLKTGNQPIFNEKRDMVVILNGEIYNFKELRKELEERGHRFYTKTDTEVLIHAYEEFGFECLKHLRGMFSFAIYDKKKKILFLARDRIGIKPLYWTKIDNELIFASEIKAILEYERVKRELDLYSLSLYLMLQYVPSDLTMFRGIKKLRAGEFMVYREGNLKIERYWNSSMGSDEKMDLNSAIEMTDKLLEESMRFHLISDVPVGIFLSGGLDSSAMVAYAERVSNGGIRTFTIGYGKEGQTYDERVPARVVAKIFGTEHTEIEMTSDAILQLPKIIYYMDEPIADLASLPLFILFNEARKSVKVIITGEGGDELFGGYPRYVLNKIDAFLDRFPEKMRLLFSIFAFIPFISQRNRRILKRLIRRIPDIRLKNLLWVSNFNDTELRSLLRVPPDGNPLEKLVKELDIGEFKTYLDEAMALDLRMWLVDDILMKVDKTSMANSVEARVPILDHRVVEFLSSLPSNFKIRGIRTKFLFKEVLKKVLPEEIIKRRKVAFRIPASEWLKREWLPLFKENLLDRPSSLLKEFFNVEYIKKLFQNHISGVEDNSQKLFNLLCLDLWFKIYFERSSFNSPSF
jgi:asparagine synthase (glutamine-hydrolysing)